MSSQFYKVLNTWFTVCSDMGNGNLDGVFFMVSPYDTLENWVLAIWENTGQESFTFLAVPKACTVYGFGIATFLAGIGILQQDIVVPVVLYTGLQIQFGAVFVLEPTFPVCTLLSRPFDLSREDDAQEAAGYIIKIKEHCKETERKVSNMLSEGFAGRSLPNTLLSTMRISLCTKRYFLKPIIQSPTEDSVKGFELVGNGKSAEYGAYRMVRVFNRLAARGGVSSRDSICFPICFRERTSSTKLSLVFEDLTRKEDGAYSVGLPDKIELWDQWMSSVETAVKEMHAASVVHVDLYPSNIMWRKSPDASGGVEIKLVDFDVAHPEG